MCARVCLRQCRLIDALVPVGRERGSPFCGRACAGPFEASVACGESPDLTVRPTTPSLWWTHRAHVYICICILYGRGEGDGAQAGRCCALDPLAAQLEPDLILEPGRRQRAQRRAPLEEPPTARLCRNTEQHASGGCGCRGTVGRLGAQRARHRVARARGAWHACARGRVRAENERRARAAWVA